MLSIEQVYCSCVTINQVVCDVSDKNNTLKFDHWKCARFINKIPVFSSLEQAHDNAIVSWDTSEGTSIPVDVHMINTIKTEQVQMDTTIGNSDLTNLSLRNNLSTIALKQSSNMSETTPSFVDFNESRYSSMELLKDRVSTSSYTHTHTLDDTTGLNESHYILKDGFYQRFIIVSATCIAVLIAATITICVYRNYNRNSGYILKALSFKRIHVHNTFNTRVL
ncbi:hypothetical protein DPMN_189568 [Dreissena polymorpha]|uniref:Uncharacterized protein n=1 Tax=Dreissena polymorpha TaxID=45954 RepID=A0A9D4DTE1_DREPO|nr:hypothetical protein DPMN_189568 [Dreissena polymorpha]